MIEKKVRTIQIPIEPDAATATRLLAAMEECRKLSQWYSVMLPSHFDHGKVLPSGKSIPNKRVAHLIKDSLQHVECNVLGNDTRSVTLCLVAANYNSVGRNWYNGLWRVPWKDFWRVCCKYKPKGQKKAGMWGWIIRKMEDDGWTDPGASDTRTLLEKAVEFYGDEPAVRKLILDKIFADVKPINRSSRPTYDKFHILPLRDKSIRLISPTEILFITTYKRDGGHFSVKVSPSKVGRHRISHEPDKVAEHYQEEFLIKIIKEMKERDEELRIDKEELKILRKELKELKKDGESDELEELKKQITFLKKEVDEKFDSYLRHGSGQVIKKKDGWYLHLSVVEPLRASVLADDSLPVYFAGLHGGIYRPMTLVVKDVTGRTVFQYVHDGKFMLHQWRWADAKYRKLQRKASLLEHDPFSFTHDYIKRRKTNDKPVPTERVRTAAVEFFSDEDDELGVAAAVDDILEQMVLDGNIKWDTWMNKAGCVFAGWRFLTRARFQRKLSDLKLAKAFRASAGRTLSLATRRIHNNLQNGIADCLKQLRDMNARIILVVHDWTGIRNTALRRRMIVGGDRVTDDMPRWVRHLINRWPFYKINKWLEDRVGTLLNVQMYLAPPLWACKVCAKCIDVGWGRHGKWHPYTKGDEWFFEHWGHEFRCHRCGGRYNADLNAASSLSFFAAEVYARVGITTVAKDSDVRKWLKELYSFAKAFTASNHRKKRKKGGSK